LSKFILKVSLGSTNFSNFRVPWLASNHKSINPPLFWGIERKFGAVKPRFTEPLGKRKKLGKSGDWLNRGTEKLIKILPTLSSKFSIM
jgi:hypothetical protein